MKLLAVVLVVLLSFTLAAFPPQIGRSQGDSGPVIQLAKPVDTQGLAPSTVALIDSFNAGYIRISTKTDSVIALARELENKLQPSNFIIRDYEPPVPVIRFRFENKTVLAQYDSARGIFIEKLIVLQ